MTIAFTDTSAARLIDIVRLAFGCIVFFAILCVFIGVMAAPIYATASLIAEAGAPAWLIIATGSAAGIAEIYGLALAASVFDRVED